MIIPSMVKMAFSEGFYRGYLTRQVKKTPFIWGGRIFSGFSVPLTGVLGERIEANYQDSYCFAELTGSGEEVVKVTYDQRDDSVGSTIMKTTEETWTRSYQGGVINETLLTSWGLTPKDVLRALHGFLMDNNGQTRLDKNLTVRKGDWSYIYRLLTKAGADLAETRGVQVSQEALVDNSGVMFFVHFFEIQRVR